MPFPLRRVLDPIAYPVSLTDMKNYLRVDITDDDSLIQTLIAAATERAEDMTSRCLLPQQWVFSFDHFPRYGLYAWGLEGAYGWHHHHGRHSIFKNEHLAIILPRGPVLSVDSIQYMDTTGTLQTLDPSVYVTDLLSEPARILPAWNKCWPIALWEVNSVTVKFTAGYQQAVTENVTLSATAPFTATVTRAANAVSLTSCVDAASLISSPLSPTAVPATMTAGVITATGTANEVLTVTYQTSNIPQSFIHAIKLIASAWYENRAEVVQGSGNFNSMPMPLSAESLLGTYELFKVGYPRS